MNGRVWPVCFNSCKTVTLNYWSFCQGQAGVISFVWELLRVISVKRLPSFTTNQLIAGCKKILERGKNMQFYFHKNNWMLWIIVDNIFSWKKNVLRWITAFLFYCQCLAKGHVTFEKQVRISPSHYLGFAFSASSGCEIMILGYKPTFLTFRPGIFQDFWTGVIFFAWCDTQCLATLPAPTVANYKERGLDFK